LFVFSLHRRKENFPPEEKKLFPCLAFLCLWNRETIASWFVYWYIRKTAQVAILLLNVYVGNLSELEMPPSSESICKRLNVERFRGFSAPRNLSRIMQHCFTDLFEHVRMSGQKRLGRILYIRIDVLPEGLQQSTYKSGKKWMKMVTNKAW